MKILIIGANGSIGGRLVLRCLKEGHHVTSVTTSENMEPLRKQSHVIKQIPMRCTTFGPLFEGEHFDLCINTSGSPSVGFSCEFKEKDHYLNFTIPQMLIAAIHQYDSNCKLINLSSAAIYGNPAHLPITEEIPARPISPYGEHKSMAESAVSKAFAAGMQTISLRIFSAYGIGMKKQLFYDLDIKCRDHDRVELFGTGNESRDFIYIDDIAELTLRYAEQGIFDGSAVNLCSGIETTIQNAAQEFIHNASPGKSLNFNGIVRTGDPQNWLGDNSKLLSMIDFEFTPFEEGIKKYVHWLKNETCVGQSPTGRQKVPVTPPAVTPMNSDECSDSEDND